MHCDGRYCPEPEIVPPQLFLDDRADTPAEVRHVALVPRQGAMEIVRRYIFATEAPLQVDDQDATRDRQTYA